MTGVLAMMVAGGVQFNPVPGTYSDNDPSGTLVQFTITASQSVAWTWSQTQLSGTGGGSANVVSGNSATSITFQVVPGATSRSVRFDVTVLGRTYAITLSIAETGGGGVVGATVTL